MILRIIMKRIDETNKLRLAKKIGISESFLHMIKSGQRGPGLETAKKLAKELGVSLDDFARYSAKRQKRWKRARGL